MVHKRIFRSLIFFLGTAFFSYSSFGVIKGQFDIDLKSGGLKGSFCLPQEDFKERPYEVYLNHIFSLKSATDATRKKVKFTKKFVSSGLLYRFAKEISFPLCLKYVAQTAVYQKSEPFFLDSKKITFYNHIFSATQESAWYPIIVGKPGNYSRASRLFNGFTSYEIRVRCLECDSIYISGSAPQKGPLVTFNFYEEIPVSLIAGQVPVERKEDLYFLGNFEPKEQVFLQKVATKMLLFFKSILGTRIPYLAMTKIFHEDYLREDMSLYPAISLDQKLKSAVAFTKKEQRLLGLAEQTMRFYFGMQKRISVQDPWFYLFYHSIPRYYALRFLQKTNGEKSLQKFTEAVQVSLKNMEPGRVMRDALRSLERPEDYLLVYDAAPLVFLSLGQAFSSSRVDRFFRLLMKKKELPLGQKDFARIFINVFGEPVWYRIKKQCLESVPRESCWTMNFSD